MHAITNMVIFFFLVMVLFVTGQHDQWLFVLSAHEALLLLSNFLPGGKIFKTVKCCNSVHRILFYYSTVQQTLAIHNFVRFSKENRSSFLVI